MESQPTFPPNMFYEMKNLSLVIGTSKIKHNHGVILPALVLPGFTQLSVLDNSKPLPHSLTPVRSDQKYILLLCAHFLWKGV